MWGCKKTTCLRLSNPRAEWWDMAAPRKLRHEQSMLQEAAMLNHLWTGAERAAEARTRGGERGALTTYALHATHKGGCVPLAALPHTPNGMRIMALTDELHNDWGEAPMCRRLCTIPWLCRLTVKVGRQPLFPSVQLQIVALAYPAEGVLTKTIEVIAMLMAQSQLDIVNMRLALLRQVLPRSYQLPSTLTALSSGEQKKRMGRWLPYLLEGLEIIGGRPDTTVALQGLAVSYTRLALIKGADTLSVGTIKGELHEALVQL